MSRSLKIFLFVLSAVIVFIVGIVVADVIWQMNYHRYASPNTGYYHGYVTADLTDARTGAYWLRIKGESEPQWYWRCPTNFVYKHLDLQINSFGSASETEELHASLELPSMRFRSAHTNTTLSADLLAALLLTPGESPTNGMQQMAAIMDFFRAAGEGKLPGPKHHRHRIEEPVDISLSHWLTGRGIPGTYYAWLVLWIALVVFVAKRVFKKPVAIMLPKEREL